MKRIFIYYSLTGNGDVLASYLKKSNIEVRKVLTKDKMPKNKFGMILTGGFLAGINHKSELIDFNDDINNYEEIIIGSPIWNGRLSCPINSVLDTLSLENKKITFIFYSGSGKAPKAKLKVKSYFPDAKVINIKEPKNNKNEIVNVIKLIESE